MSWEFLPKHFRDVAGKGGLVTGSGRLAHTVPGEMAMLGKVFIDEEYWR
jgi:hypothetical protein